MKYVGLLIDIKQDSYGKLADILLPKDNDHIKSQLTISTGSTIIQDLVENFLPWSITEQQEQGEEGPKSWMAPA